MKKTVLKFINPVSLIKAYNYQKKNSKYEKSSYDLELYLYSKILKNDMLHYGYFEDINTEPETISIKQVEDAQIKYAENIIEKIKNTKDPVLDVGCGMGGLSALMLQKGLKVEALTPNKNQIAHIENKYKGLTCHQCKFEDFNSDKKFGTMINSESLQYITLDKAFSNVEKYLLPDGRWIIVDFFRVHAEGISRSSHLLEEFLQKTKENSWKIVYEKDITANVLPTMKFVNMYATRFLLPVMHYAFEKLRFKKAWIYYLIQDMKDSITKKINKELASVDPEKFANEKKYILFVLERNV
ncbi:MAG TPA: class I SAM-dependent methyltransferase [Paludibacter sp.]